MTNRDAGQPLFDATTRFDSLPANGRKLDVEPTAAQREAIAGRMNVDSVDSFSAHLDIMPIKGGVQARGRLWAVVTQQCVVSFQPVSQTIEERVERIFLPGREETYTGPASQDVYVDLEGDDLPDYFEGPEIDFSEFLLETLALAIDPYPRAPDAEVPEEGFGDDPADSSPFADLKHLKSTRD